MRLIIGQLKLGRIVIDIRDAYGELQLKDIFLYFFFLMGENSMLFILLLVIYVTDKESISDGIKYKYFWTENEIKTQSV